MFGQPAREAVYPVEVYTLCRIMQQIFNGCRPIGRSIFPVCLVPMRLNISERFRLRLAAFRKLRGLTQQELEKRIGKSDKESGYISRLETGAIETPPFDMIQVIANALAIDVGEFFFSEGLDENSEELVAAINAVLPVNDPRELRKVYRLILVSQEKYSK